MTVTTGSRGGASAEGACARPAAGSAAQAKSAATTSRRCGAADGVARQFGRVAAMARVMTGSGFGGWCVAAVRGWRRGSTTRSTSAPLPATAATRRRGARAARASPAPVRAARARRRARCCAWCPAGSGAATAGRSRRRSSSSSRRARPRRAASMPVSSASSRARRLGQRLAGLLAAGHRLPVAGEVGTLEQQHVEIPRVDEGEDRDRDLCVSWPVGQRVLRRALNECGGPPGLPRECFRRRRTQNGTCRSRQNSAASARISSAVSQSFGCALR